jgi:hypothetical protein
MATTISFPTTVTDPTGTNAANAFADDGTLTDLIVSTDADIVWATFSSLSIPAGATIDGIEIVAEINGKAPANTPLFALYNGTSYSTQRAFTGTATRSLVVHDPAWGANNDLWGLSWDATTAAGILVRMDCGSLTSGRSFRFDYLKVRVTYTAAAAGYTHDVNSVAAASIGKVNTVATASIGKINSVD